MVGIKRKLEVFYLDYWTVWMQWQAWAKSELWKPLGLLNEFSWVSVLLITSGVKLRFWMVLIVYVGLFVCLVLLGYFYVKTGAQKVVTKMGNKENPEIQEILNRLERIEQKINSNKNG